MALIDEEYMRNTFNIHEDVEAGRITPYIVVASIRLKRWVGANVYATEVADLITVLKLAEGTLVMHFMQLNLNTHIRPKGLVKTESVEGNVTIQYLNPNETAQSAQLYLEQAQMILSGYIEDGDSMPTPEFIETDINTDTTISDTSNQEWLT